MPSTNERHERLTTMGLHRLAQSEKLALRVELTGLSYTELTGEDLVLWQKFLPTQYSVDRFAYDSIPDEALDEIETAQAIKCFDSISIWTPEHNDAKGRLRRRATGVINRLSNALQESFDPLAVGIIDDQNGVRHFYAIVRWAESLEPIETIKAYVQKVDRQERMMLIGIPAALVVVFALLAIPMHFWVIAPIVVTAVVVVIFAIMAADNRAWSRGWA